MSGVIPQALKTTQRFLSDNSPTILTSLGAAGVVSTAVLAAKGGKLSEISLQVDAEHENRDEPYNLKEELQRTWKNYIPAAAVGAASIICIISANSIHSKRTAAIATAYSLTETAFKEYKNKVVEQIGAKQEERVRDEVAKDRVKNDPLSSKEVIFVGNKEVLCYETMDGRYFKSNMETLRKAQNDINAQILNEGYASKNDFCRLIGLAPTGYGEEVGWNTDTLLDLQFTSTIADDGEPALAIGYAVTPVRNYYKFG